MSKYILLLLLLVPKMSFAQQRESKSYPYKVAVKTNIFNLIIIPSLHVEYRITKKSSLVGNFHRGNIVFFTENNWLNATLDYRRYFARSTSDALRGFYLSGGFAYHYDYDDVILDDMDQVVRTGKSKMGGVFRTGYQFGLSKHFLMDLGVGLAILSDVHEYQRDPVQAQGRLMAGIGYRF
ncbi:MAG: DUF3575 domain-containing protein [Saprospiraceae bacterium]|nr:DUF3575 domain-containing protein [Saprospiraceae bacterium]MBK8080413.1 DUF3575 domain-containing protein [Saprospiraceae bacterium]MBK8371291.1 DUF3575 domain-containing protein [Saprospiraceae bacterium]MBK8545851.1 DUF3575 domain-containing protein [Saprospiraceae bacterium]MBK8819621.1 DUF3575 domain-containing protein [Saprospiraceae bacterium]